MEHLVTAQEVVKLGRPIGQVEPAKLTAYITEAEQMYIKPTLGAPLFLRLLDDENAEDENLTRLLEGGTYEDCNGMQVFAGLKTAIAYFVYAQNVMSGDFQSTRYGMVVKDGDFSTRLSSKARSDCYNNALEVANSYLRECIAYCKAKNLLGSKSSRRVYSAGGYTIRKIGN